MSLKVAADVFDGNWTFDFILGAGRSVVLDDFNGSLFVGCGWLSPSLRLFAAAVLVAPGGISIGITDCIWVAIGFVAVEAALFVSLRPTRLSGAMLGRVVVAAFVAVVVGFSLAVVTPFEVALSLFDSSDVFPSIESLDDSYGYWCGYRYP